MPKKKRKETPAEQSKRFKEEAEKLIEDGELNPTEADKALDAMVASQRTKACHQGAQTGRSSDLQKVR